MSSASEPPEEIECSYGDDSFETAEDSILADHRSSPVVWGRQESVFLAESSSSTEDDSPVQRRTASESYETAPGSVNATESASIVTEEPDYSEHFENLGSNLSEEELSISRKDESISKTEEQEVQDDFVRKKLAVLSSRQSSSREQTYEKTDEHETVDGLQEVNNFCSKKLKVMKLRKEDVADSGHCPLDETTARSTGRKSDLQDQNTVCIGGNKRQIESLRIENLMKKAEKLKEQDFHNPRQCSDCRTMKSTIANNDFLKRKLEIAKRAEFEERLQLHLYQKDSATLLAEIVNSCTRPTAPPSEVWEKLLCKKDKE